MSQHEVIPNSTNEGIKVVDYELLEKDLRLITYIDRDVLLTISNDVILRLNYIFGPLTI